MTERVDGLRLFRPRDIVVYGLLAAVFVMVLSLVSGMNRGTGVVVQIEGEEMYRFSTLEPSVNAIEFDGKHLMDLVIENGDAYIQHSQCPLHLCERDFLSETGVLVCIPQKVLITFEEDGVDVHSREVDLVTR